MVESITVVRPLPQLQLVANHAQAPRNALAAVVGNVVCSIRRPIALSGE